MHGRVRAAVVNHNCKPSAAVVRCCCLKNVEKQASQRRMIYTPSTSFMTPLVNLAAMHPPNGHTAASAATSQLMPPSRRVWSRASASSACLHGTFTLGQSHEEHKHYIVPACAFLHAQSLAASHCLGRRSRLLRHDCASKCLTSI